MKGDLAQLEGERRGLYEDLSRIGDFRRGTLAVNFRRCGKPNCACVKPSHAGHGPQYLFVSRAGGRLRSMTLKPGPELQKLEREVATHRRFREIIARIVEISDRICQLRQPEPLPAVERRSSSGSVRILRSKPTPAGARRTSRTPGIRYTPG